MGADNTGADDERLANAFARGLEIFAAKREEEEAKNRAQNENQDEGGAGSAGNGDNKDKPRSWTERLLGGIA